MLSLARRVCRKQKRAEFVVTLVDWACLDLRAAGAVAAAGGVLRLCCLCTAKTSESMMLMGMGAFCYADIESGNTEQQVASIAACGG